MTTNTSEAQLFTVGHSTLEINAFISLLKEFRVSAIADVRSSPYSQFCPQFNTDALHLPELAPTKDILDEYKKNRGDWSVYEREFLELKDKRRIQDSISKDLIAGGCLLCSEHLPKHCHRRLVVEYLARHWGNIETTHITEYRCIKMPLPQ